MGREDEEQLAPGLFQKKELVFLAQDAEHGREGNFAVQLFDPFDAVEEKLGGVLADGLGTYVGEEGWKVGDAQGDHGVL